MLRAMPPSASPRAAVPDAPRALIGWRLLALFYDLWPCVALWMLVAVPFTLADSVWLHHDARHVFAPFGAAQWLLWAVCWGVTGAYAVLSWSRGGQTLGMRPWRLQVVDAAGHAPGRRALLRRYVAGTLSLLPAGAGFWWAWFDAGKLTWHDRLSGTRMRRLPKRGA